MTARASHGAARRPRARALTAAALLLAAAMAAPGSTAAGVFVAEGKVAFEIRQNGSPVRDADFDVAVRTRNENPPRVVFEGRNKTLVSLPDGDYDCLVTHHHLFTEPVKYHHFAVAAGKTVVVPSDVRTYEVMVRPYLDGKPADDRAIDVSYENTISSLGVRHPGVSVVVLPEMQYLIKLRARDASGATVTRERTLYLACSQEIRFDL